MKKLKFIPFLLLITLLFSACNKTGNIIPVVETESAAQNLQHSENSDKVISCVAAGGLSSAVIFEDGTVDNVGRGTANETLYTDSWIDIQSVSVGYMYILGLQDDGTVITAGNCPPSISEWTDIKSISAGAYTSAGIRSDGTVVASTAFMDYGQCQADDWTDIVQVYCAQFTTIGVRSDGTVVATEIKEIEGEDAGFDRGQTDVGDWSDIIQVAAGTTFTVGLKSDGKVVAAGDRSNGRCDVAEWSDIIAISCGDNFTAGLKSDGTVLFTGVDDGESDSSKWKDIISISAGTQHLIGLTRDHKVVVAGSNLQGQCDVDEWNGEEDTVEPITDNSDDILTGLIRSLNQEAVFYYGESQGYYFPEISSGDGIVSYGKSNMCFGTMLFEYLPDQQEELLKVLTGEAMYDLENISEEEKSSFINSITTTGYFMTFIKDSAGHSYRLDISFSEEEMLISVYSWRDAAIAYYIGGMDKTLEHLQKMADECRNSEADGTGAAIITMYGNSEAKTLNRSKNATLINIVDGVTLSDENIAEKELNSEEYDTEINISGDIYRLNAEQGLVETDHTIYSLNEGAAMALKNLLAEQYD